MLLTPFHSWGNRPASKSQNVMDWSLYPSPFWWVFIHLYSLYHFSRIGAVIIPIVQMRRLGLRGLRLAWEYKEQTQDLPELSLFSCTALWLTDFGLPPPHHPLVFRDAAQLTWRGCIRLGALQMPAGSNLSPSLVPACGGPGPVSTRKAPAQCNGEELGQIHFLAVWPWESDFTSLKSRV